MPPRPSCRAPLPGRAHASDAPTTRPDPIVLNETPRPCPLGSTPRPAAMHRPRAAVVLGALALATCSPYRLAGPPLDPDAVTQPFTAYLDGMASVCVIRTAKLAMAVTFVVRDNDMLVGATRGPSWFCYRAEPGLHHIAVAGEDGVQSFHVTLEPRARYYLDLGLLYRLGFVIPQARWIDEADAPDLLARSQHRVLQGAPARDSLLIGTDVAAAAVDPP